MAPACPARAVGASPPRAAARATAAAPSCAAAAPRGTTARPRACAGLLLAAGAAAAGGGSGPWGAPKLQFEREVLNFGEAVPLGLFGNTSLFFAASDTSLFAVDMVTGNYTYGSAPLGVPGNCNPSNAGSVTAPGYDAGLGLVYVRMVSTDPLLHTIVVVDVASLAPVRNVTLAGGEWTNLVLERAAAPTAAFFADLNGTVTRVALPSLVKSNVAQLKAPGLLIFMDVGAGALVGFVKSNTYPIFVTTLRLAPASLTVAMNVSSLVNSIDYPFSFWDPASGTAYALIRVYSAGQNVSMYVVSINSRTGGVTQAAAALPIFGDDAGYPGPNLYDWAGNPAGVINYVHGVGAPGALDVRPGTGFLYFAYGRTAGGLSTGLQWVVKWSLATFSLAGIVAVGATGAVPPLDKATVDALALDASGAQLLVSAQVALSPVGIVYSVATGPMAVAAPGLVLGGPSPYTSLMFMYPDPSNSAMWVRARTEDQYEGSVSVQAVGVNLATFATTPAYPYVVGRTFAYQAPGAFVNFTVPWSITNMTVHLWGAGGGGAAGPGGGGAYVTGAIYGLNSDPQDPNYCCDVLHIAVGRGGAVGASPGLLGQESGSGGAGGGAGASGGGRTFVEIAVSGAWVEVASAGGGGGGASTTTLGGGAGGVFCGHRGGDDAPGVAVFANESRLGAGAGGVGAAGGGGCQSPVGSPVDPTNYGGNSTAPGGGPGALWQGGSGANAAGSGGGGGGYFGGGGGFLAPGGGGSSSVCNSLGWPFSLAFADGQDGSGRAPGGLASPFRTLGAATAGYGGTPGVSGGDGLVVLIVPNPPASPSITPSYSPTSSASASASETSSSSSSASDTASATRSRHASRTNSHSLRASRSDTHTPARTISGSHSRGASHTGTHSRSHSRGASHTHTRAAASSHSRVAMSASSVARPSHSKHAAASHSGAPGGASRQCRWHQHKGYAHFHCWDAHATHQHPTRANPPPKCRWHYKHGKPYYWCFESKTGKLELGA